MYKAGSKKVSVNYPTTHLTTVLLSIFPTLALDMTFLKETTATTTLLEINPAQTTPTPLRHGGICYLAFLIDHYVQFLVNHVKYQAIKAI